MKCPVCLEEMRRPIKIFQCINGHTLCERCKNNPSVTTCPTCRVQMNTVSRNIFAEQAAETTFPREEESEEEEVTPELDSDVVHSNKVCKGCGVCPILGIR